MDWDDSALVQAWDQSLRLYREQEAPSISAPARARCGNRRAKDHPRPGGSVSANDKGEKASSSQVSEGARREDDGVGQQGANSQKSSK